MRRGLVKQKKVQFSDVHRKFQLSVQCCEVR